jgi:endogenous inhibitor of DNA gyrase (YacG/DUF329 family)
MANSKIIYCPRCKRKVATWDGKSSAYPIGKCEKCDKVVVYDLEKDEIRTKKIPARTTSSGMRFY